jgi:hypothetical protein
MIAPWPIVRRVVAALLLVSLVAACTPAPPPPPAVNPKAAEDLAAYQQLVQLKSYAIAVTMGRKIQNDYPGTPAAAEVARTLPQIEAQATADADTKRMAALWSYQQNKQAGGDQSAASLYSTVPGSEAERMRFILRRHSDWGESAYIFAGGRGFDCGTSCTIGVRFDDAPEVRWPAHVPETGEPALFIDRDADFVAKMRSARKITIAAKLKGKGDTTIVFEVGGYDPAQYLPLPKKS